MTKRSYTFTHAITRKPGASVINGLREVDTGAPDLDVFLDHHAAYVAALKSTGATVVELDPLEEFPDSVFVEDAALCLPEAAIAMRPGTPSRAGEAAVMADVLKEIYGDVMVIEDGHIDGGDILTTEREILVGTSARTDSTGIDALRAIVSQWGYTVREVKTPEGVLHFKTDCSLLDETTILATKRLADSGALNGYDIIHTAEGEEACANAIRFNELVIMPDGFPKTAAKLQEAGYTVKTVGNTEAGKLDGGMSCLSLRFSPPAA